MHELEMIQMPGECRHAFPGKVDEFLHAKGGSIQATPSQTAQLEPGEKNCSRHLGFVYHTGGDKKPARRQQGSGHYGWSYGINEGLGSLLERSGLFRKNNSIQIFFPGRNREGGDGEMRLIFHEYIIAHMF
jgi:hypothetical protein